jgi:hypothetical protein
MAKLLFSVPLSPWHELFAVAGAKRAMAGAALVPNEGDYAVRVVWLAGLALGLVYPKPRQQ